jgi:TonB family protein
VITTALLGSDSWGYAEASDRRFRSICRRVGLPVLVLALLLPWLRFVTEKPPEKKDEVVQYAELLPEAASAAAGGETPQPTPRPEPAQASAPAKPVQGPPPAPAQTARQQAEQAGLMKFRDQLADARNQDLNVISGRQQLVTASQAGGGSSGSAESVAGSAASDSGGIGGVGTASVTRSQGGTGLGTRRTGDVQSPVGGGGAGKSAGEGDGAVAGRTLEEIQLTFDRSKSAFFAIFNRAARETAGMGAGKVIVNLTIAPDGSVTRCEIVSSSFNNPDLEQKILTRVKMLNFGAKKVPPFNFPNYPINFIPS